MRCCSDVLTLRRLMSYIYIYIYIYIEHLFLMFLDHTQRRSTVGRTPLDEWSTRRRDLYLTTHDTHNRQISMPRLDSNPRSWVQSGVHQVFYSVNIGALFERVKEFGLGTVHKSLCSAEFDKSFELYLHKEAKTCSDWSASPSHWYVHNICQLTCRLFTIIR